MTLALLDLLTPPRRSAPHKAVTGPYAGNVTYGVPLSSLDRSPDKVARDAQAIGTRDPWIRAAERVIGDRFATVPWHLEDGEGTTVGREEGMNATAPYLAILDLLNHPYTPAPKEPQTPTPRTRSQLWRITARHGGLCGVGFWYLDQAEALGGTPLQLLYINPARMTPATNGAGQLVGWVLDARNGVGGVPLDIDKVLPFPLEHPDSGFIPAGLVESVLGKDAIVRYADRHAADVLASGGRLSGIVGPPAGETIPDEQFDQLKLDFRAASESADASRRLIILKGPVEFTQTVATPEQLALVEVANQLGRDGILALWGVPLSQIGLGAGGGLNSGETKGYDEAILWQNGVGPRLRTFAETLQYGLLDRYAALGLPVTLVVDEPEFDDETPQYERASKATSQPLTNLERRALLNLDPFGDERDDEVWMTSTMVRVYPEEEPAPIPPQFVQPPIPPVVPPIEDVPVKAQVGKREAAAMQRDVAAFLARWGESIGGKVESHAEHLARKPGDSSVWWDEQAFTDDLAAVLDPHVRAIARRTSTTVDARLASPGKASLKEMLPRLLRKVGVDIKGIADTTRERVIVAVRDGIARGLGARDLGILIRETAGFDELRAETIARTETARTLNAAAVESYREYEVTHVLVDDGDEDEPCAAAHGQTWTLEEAEADPIAHPNCVRSFAPVVGAPAKAGDVMMKAALEMMSAAIARPEPNITVNTPDVHVILPEQPAPVTHVTVLPAEVKATIEAPIVNVQAPQVTMPAAVVNVNVPEVQSMRIIEMPPATQTVRRDKAGRITEITEA